MHKIGPCFLIQSVILQARRKAKKNVRLIVQNDTFEKLRYLFAENFIIE